MCPEQRGVTRITRYRSHMTFGNDEEGTRFMLLYFEDPRMRLPGWLVSLVTSRTIPSSMAEMVAAGRRYPHRRMEHMLGKMGVTLSRSFSDVRSVGTSEEDYWSASEGEDDLASGHEQSFRHMHVKAPQQVAMSTALLPGMGVEAREVAAERGFLRRWCCCRRKQSRAPVDLRADSSRQTLP